MFCKYQVCKDISQADIQSVKQVCWFKRQRLSETW